MRHQPPSQGRISLLLVGSLIAGLIASTLLSPRDAVRRDKPELLIDKTLAVEAP